VLVLALALALVTAPFMLELVLVLPPLTELSDPAELDTTKGSTKISPNGRIHLLRRTSHPKVLSLDVGPKAGPWPGPATLDSRLSRRIRVARPSQCSSSAGAS